ncbi:MAG: O-methyltransferase [Bacillota bacterium]
MTNRIMENECLFVRKLKEVERAARKQQIPIISGEVRQFIKGLLLVHRPRLVLEIGTGIGYSTLCLARYTPEETGIISIERDENRGLAARRIFRELGLNNRVKLKIGDAREVLPLLRSSFDFVFLDGAKGQYPQYLRLVNDHLRDGSLIVADNVLYHGLVTRQGEIPHSHRTIVYRLREYLEMIEEDLRLDSRLIKLGDGLALSLRRTIDEKNRTTGSGRESGKT